MRENGAYYKQFIEVHPGGGTRRNPKRKNAGGFSTPFSNLPATSAEIDRTFEGHLKEMARGGTYGDNMEIVAFSSAFHVDVKIYQRDFAFVVSAKADGAVVPVVHIAYHVSAPHVEGVPSHWIQARADCYFPLDLGTLLLDPKRARSSYWPSRDQFQHRLWGN